MPNKVKVDLGFNAWTQKEGRYHIIGNPETTIVLAENQFRRLVASNASQVMKGSDETQKVGNR